MGHFVNPLKMLNQLFNQYPSLVKNSITINSTKEENGGVWCFSEEPTDDLQKKLKRY